MPALAALAAADWSQLPAFPDKVGVAGPFAGVSGGALLVGGGANFPERMPWEGGKKIWHDSVYVLEAPTGNWLAAGKLPRPLGYGVSVSHGDALICAGGSDAQRHYADTFRLHWRRGKLVTEFLPALPLALANMSGALAGDVLYIAGGAEVPGELWATNLFFALDLSAHQLTWRELERVPGPPRLLATAATHQDTFYLFGGATLAPNTEGKVTRRYLRDAFSYRPSHGWRRLADLPKPSVAAPAPAPWVNGKFLLLGGDDGAHVDFVPPDKHPGFPKSILAYDPERDEWSEVDSMKAARVTTACIEWRERLVIPSGEVRPGVRSPEVWAMEAALAKSGAGDVEK